MSFDYSEIVNLINAWFWPFFRVGAMLIMAPIFGASFVPVRIRLGLAIMLSLVIVPVIPAPPAVVPFSAEGILITAHQVLIGLALGFALRLVWSVFELAGQVISQPMGLHFAAMVDPASGVQVPVISQFYIVLVTLLFLSLDGHLLLLRTLAESFTVLPVTVNGLGREGLWHLVSQMGWVFSSAILVALPAVAALLMVNFSFAVMTRAAPQLNIFAVGFPTALVLGFFIMGLTLPGILGQTETMLDSGLQFAEWLISGRP